MDDERLVLRSLERVVRAYHPAWEVRSAQCPLAALEVLREYAADVVVTDLSMPKMHGVQLLRELSDRHPSSKRLVYSAHIESLGRAEFGDLVYAALLKPARPEAIVMTLERAVFAAGLGQELGTQSA